MSGDVICDKELAPTIRDWQIRRPLRFRSALLLMVDAIARDDVVNIIILLPYGCISKGKNEDDRHLDCSKHLLTSFHLNAVISLLSHLIKDRMQQYNERRNDVGSLKNVKSRKRF